MFGEPEKHKATPHLRNKKEVVRLSFHKALLIFQHAYQPKQTPIPKGI
jgi:hypothetical protein